eukprot:698183-Pelagomonas_calceolata.AAC.1
MPERTGLGVSALIKNMLFILHTVMDITEVTGRRNCIIHEACNFQSMDMETETGHASTTCLGKSRGMRDMRVLCWKCTPVMIGEFFAVEISRMVIRPKNHNQLTQVLRDI